MKELPMLFKGPLVRAIIEGRKTQTRRPVRKSNSFTGAGYKFDDLDLEAGWIDRGFADENGKYRSQYLKAPVVRGPHGDDDVVDRVYSRFAPQDCWDYESASNDKSYSPGCRIWVRETHHITTTNEVIYRSDYPLNAEERGFDHIPPEDQVRWCSSIHMPRWASRILLDVEAVRVERLQDITPEDVLAEGIGQFKSSHPDIASEMFARTWNKIHGEDAWHENPYVWIIEFRRVDST